MKHRVIRGRVYREVNLDRLADQPAAFRNDELAQLQRSRPISHAEQQAVRRGWSR